MIALLLASTLALADPVPVVAVGGGLVVGDAALPVSVDPVPGTWVTALADCLEERAPGRWAVIDRSADGETAAALRERAPALRALHPGMVLVGAGDLAARDPDPVTLRADVEALVGAVREASPGVLLVGPVPATLAQLPQPARAAQQTLDGRARTWNAALDAAASHDEGVVHVDLLADWPADDTARSQLTTGAFRLSAQGHARVAASVCDAVVAWKPPAP